VHKHKNQIKTILHNKIPHTNPRNYPLTWGNLLYQLLASSSDSAIPSLQMPSRSDQPFFHNPPDRQTDKTDTHTHWQTDQQMVQATKPVPIPTYALLMILMWLTIYQIKIS